MNRREMKRHARGLNKLRCDLVVDAVLTLKCQKCGVEWTVRVQEDELAPNAWMCRKGCDSAGDILPSSLAAFVSSLDSEPKARLQSVVSLLASTAMRIVEEESDGKQTLLIGQDNQDSDLGRKNRESRRSRK